MRTRLGITAATTAALLVSAAVMPAAAASRQDIRITALTYFATDPDPFTASGLGTACADGTVVDGDAHLEFHRGAFVFAGFKVLTCDADTGFVLRLNARFGDWGSEGTWAVVDAWGDLAGISGAGSLVGGPLDGGITDDYSGTITR